MGKSITGLFGQVGFISGTSGGSGTGDTFTDILVINSFLMTNPDPVTVLQIQNTSDSISPNTGSVVFSGGLGVGKKVFANEVNVGNFFKIFKQGLPYYSEGTWIPKLFFYDGGITGIQVNKYFDQTGTWVKVGNYVVVYFRLHFNYQSGTIDSTIVIRNLPFIPIKPKGCCCIMDIGSTELTGLSKNYVASVDPTNFHVFFQNVVGTSFVIQVFGASNQQVTGYLRYTTDTISPLPT